jgi:rubredoxin
MACPVCNATDVKLINVRVSRESDLKQLVGSTWEGRNVARCNECGVLYDHQYTESDEPDGQAERSHRAPETVNCPDCGAPNSGDQNACSHCGSSLDSSTE